MTTHCKSCRRDLDESHYVETYKTCNECRTKKKQRSTKRLTLKDCQDLAESKGGKCVSTEYKNSRSKMKWQCSENHEWETTIHNIKNGHWCPHCAGNVKLTLKDCQDLAESKGGKCLSTEYKNSKTKMKWQCSENHEWEAKLDNIRYGKWCRHCAGNVKLTLKDCQDLADSKGGKCLSTEYKNCDHKMKWKCSKGHMGYNFIHC